MSTILANQIEPTGNGGWAGKGNERARVNGTQNSLVIHASRPRSRLIEHDREQLSAEAWEVVCERGSDPPSAGEQDARAAHHGWVQCAE